MFIHFFKNPILLFTCYVCLSLLAFCFRVDKVVLQKRQMDSSSLSFDQPYTVYLYDDIEDCVKEKMKFTIPSWVILNTLTMLEDKKLKEDAQKVTEMGKDITNLESIEKLYEDMSQDSPERKSTVIESDFSLEQRLSEVPIEATKRKVSIVPLLKQITEEENNMLTVSTLFEPQGSISKDEKIKILENKVFALQNSLLEIQELISIIKLPETPTEMTEL